MDEIKTNKIKQGFWQHYKGNIYIVLDTIIDATRDEDVVLYRNEEGMLFTRTVDDFLSVFELNSKVVKRFIFLGHESL